MLANEKSTGMPEYGRASNSVDVIIIGAGISGICTAIDMIKHGNGRNFLIFEKSSQVGGTWNDNVYPGCCCDVWGHLYSFSFEPNPDWSREYPSQEELHSYLIRVSQKWHLYQHIRFNTEVEAATWSEHSGKWRVRVRHQAVAEQRTPSTYTVSADFVVSAVGQLSLPKYPNIPGIEAFSGKTMHSARWDWDYSLQGQRVAIVGTGSTAAQIVPEVAKYAKRLVICQRSPAWIMPRHDGPIGMWRRIGYRYVPGMLKRKRQQLMDLRESVFWGSFDKQGAEHERISEVSRRHLQTQLAGSWNAELRCKLTPKYPFNCKRITVSDDYYPALTKENVHLETNQISHVSAAGIHFADGSTQQVDLIIFATGFDTNRFLHPINIQGRNGHLLSTAWQGGAAAYLGITVNDFPNLGMLYGPNTNLAYNSLILPIEAQSRYINCLISAVLSAKRSSQSLALEPRADVVAQYNGWVQDRLSKSTFADPSCNSWFKTTDGKIVNNWCGSAIEYQERTSYVDWKDFVFTGSAADDWHDKPATKWKRVVEESQPWRVIFMNLLPMTVFSSFVLVCVARFGPIHYFSL